MWRFLAGLFFLGFLLFIEQTEALRLKTNWGKRVDLSEKIILGKVIDVHSYWNSERSLINTDVKILVEEYLKGTGERELTLTIPGGSVGDRTHWVSDTPSFCVGQHVIVFLESSGQITGGPDGVYYLDQKDGDVFLLWLRAYMDGDPNIPKDGPPLPPKLDPRLQRK